VDSAVAFPFTHNLAKLVEICAGVDPAFRDLLPSADLLTPFAVKVRYDDQFWPSSVVTTEARSAAVSIQQFVLSRLAQGDPPPSSGGL
jgi:hypothetical protein